MKKTDFVSAFRDSVEVLKLNKAKMAEIYGNKSALMWACFILGGPFVLNALLISIFSSIFTGFYIRIALLPVLALACAIFLIGAVVHFGFKNKVDYLGVFRVLSYATLPMWAIVLLMIVSFVGMSGGSNFFSLITWVTWIWVIVVAYNFLISHFKFSQQNAIIVCVVSVIGFTIIQSIIGRILLGGYYSAMFF